MGYRLTVEEPRKVGIDRYTERALQPAEVRLRTLHSGISAGTELTLFNGSNPYLSKAWDPDLRLFQPARHSWTYPHPAIGYEEVGEVVELGPAVEGLEPGDRVWGTWGHKSTHIADAAWARARRLPDGLPALCGIFSQIGSIGLNAVLDAQINIGETVAVFGQGAPGLIVTQLARASGARVIAVDRLAKRLEMARASGADHVVDAAESDAATEIKQLTGGRGADVSIEITGVYAALHEAIRATAYNSRVVVSGFFQGEARHLHLGEEFHHNRIELVCSQISGIARTLDHRWDRLRLDRTIMDLQAKGRVDFERLVSHRFPADRLQEAYEMLADRPEEALQVVLEFGDEDRT